MAEQDEQTYVEWLKANPAPSFEALIARHGSYEAIPPLEWTAFVIGNAVGGRAPPRTDRLHNKEAAMPKPTDKAPHENQKTGFLATFDPDVPGYVFWLVMLVMISLQLLLVGR